MIILVGIIGSGMILSQGKAVVKQQLVKQIIEFQKGEGEVDKEKLQAIASEVEDKKTNSSAKEAFILGYQKYEEGDLEQAQQYLRKVSLGKDEVIKLYATVLLMQIGSGLKGNEEAVSLVGETLSTLSAETYNAEHETITNLMQSVIYLEGGKACIIDSLEKVLENEHKLDVEVMCDLKNKLAVLYFYNGNYARGIERFLEVMAHSESMENKYYGAKAQIDLGVIYGALGNYEEAKSNFKKALDMKITDLEDMAFVKTYASINLYENMLYEEDYEGVKAINETVNSYAQYLPENLYDSITIMNEIFLCNYYIRLGDGETAKALLEEIKEKLKEPEQYRYLSVHTNYTLLQAALKRLSGDVKGAASLYKELLQQEDKQFKKYILKNLSELLNEHGYYREANEYEQQLSAHYEQEAVAVNLDYSEYALYKYENQKRLIEEANQKLRKYIYNIIYAIVGLSAIIAFYLKYTRLIQINKLDGLTKIYNRRYFEEYYKVLQRKDHPFAIMIFDIDCFKAINDTYGHLAGDKVIKKVVELGKSALPKDGKLFRYGGEEFIVVLENYYEEEVLRIAECIRCMIEDYQWQQEMHVTVSIGVAQADSQLRNILDKADQNLYAAKKQGRNQTVYR